MKNDIKIRAKYEELKKSDPFNVALCGQYGIKDKAEVVSSILTLNLDNSITDQINGMLEFDEDIYPSVVMNILLRKVLDMSEMFEYENEDLNSIIDNISKLLDKGDANE